MMMHQFLFSVNPAARMRAGAGPIVQRSMIR
jgi:hypothetical protein